MDRYMTDNDLELLYYRVQTWQVCNLQSVFNAGNTVLHSDYFDLLCMRQPNSDSMTICQRHLTGHIPGPDINSARSSECFCGTLPAPTHSLSYL